MVLSQTSGVEGDYRVFPTRRSKRVSRSSSCFRGASCFGMAPPAGSALDFS